MVAATAPSKRWRRVSRLLQQTKSIVVLLVVLAAWEAAVPLLAIPRYLLPSPSSILARMVTSPDLLAQNALVTTRETLEGFALGVVVGVALAVLIVHWRWLEDSLYPIL